MRMVYGTGLRVKSRDRDRKIKMMQERQGDMFFPAMCSWAQLVL